MEYISTRGRSAAASAAAAIVQGIADDGGLFVPASLPSYFPPQLAEMDYCSLAKQIFELYLSDFSAGDISQIVDEAYSPAGFPDGAVATVSLDNTEVLELWHGPTSAFKDMALQVLPRLLVKSLSKTGGDKEIIILVATSGDTGTAALEGFRDVPHTQITVFYPKQGVSAIQELQMVTTGGSNTCVIGVDGNFDDCQNGVKLIFGDKQLAAQMAARGQYFSSANSINWGRLLPQIVYYFYGYGRMVAKKKIAWGDAIDIAVPTGNFGDILAGWYAMKMGLPVHQFICASNCNNVLTDALEKGVYDRRRPFHKTISPSMDILISSNFERFIFDISGNDSAYTAAAFEQLRDEGIFTISDSLRARFAAQMRGGYADEDSCRATIKRVFEQYRYLLDPHSAVAYQVADQLRGKDAPPLLLVSTASPYKFPAAVLDALGKLPQDKGELELPAYLNQLSGMPIPPNLAILGELPIRHHQVCAKDDMEAAVIAHLGLD